MDHWNISMEKMRLLPLKHDEFDVEKTDSHCPVELALAQSEIV